MNVRATTLVRILFWTPIAAAVPAFFIIRDAVPDLNRNSIGDGFRKLNVFVDAFAPVVGVCWALAILVASLRAARNGSAGPIVAIILTILAFAVLWAAL